MIQPYGIVLGSLCVLASVITLRRISRFWATMSRRCRLAELLQIVGLLLVIAGSFFGGVDVSLGTIAILVGWMVASPEELTRPVKLWHRSRERSDSES